MTALQPVIAQRTCDGCGRGIAFRPTSERKPDGKVKFMVLDTEPNPLGNVWIDGETARVLGAGASAPEGEEVYMPHWKTCPAADRFRRPTRRGPDD